MIFLKVEGQWNGTKDEMMLNIPNFPHLHSSLSNLDDPQRYPHPVEYFMASLCGTITLVIENYAGKNNVILTNLYIIITCEINNSMEEFSNITVEIRLDSSLSPRQLTELQNILLEKEPVFNLINNNDVLTINWD